MNAADLPTAVSPGLPAPVPPRWRDIALAALAGLLAGEPPAVAAPEERYLRDALACAGGAPAAGWPATALAALADPAPADAPLARARAVFGLDAAAALALALAAAVEDDPVAGRVIAWLQAPLATPRPTLALLARALAPLAALDTADPADDPRQREARLLHRLADGPAQQHGLVLCDAPPERPLCDATWRVPPFIAAALAGIEGGGPGAPAPTCWQPPVGLADLDPALDASLSRWAVDLGRLPRAGLVLRSAAPHEACGLAAEIVRRRGARPAWFTVERGLPLPAGTAAWLLLTGRVPVFLLDASPGEVVDLPPLPLHDGPLLVAAGLDGGVRHDGPLADWRVPRPGPEARRRLWAQALGDAGDGTPALAALAAQRHRSGAAQIADHAALARLLGGGAADAPSLQQAAAMTPSGRALDALALPLTAPVPDDALVVSAALRADLDRILQRCRQRDALAQRLGVAARTRACSGVRMLFTGGSGTGKSLAGQWLAQRLGLPVWRVDLAATLSKWIGETEKHLAELLARAEHADAVLLFDEADSLFGKRTEVSTANDRFANGQTNDLLQRIESHEGIVVLTSNARSRFDAAFTRRLDFIIDFAAPDAQARRALWLAHLGDAAALSGPELNRLAALGDIAGGHVRNAVLAAAAQAGERGEAIAYADVADGLRAELRKLGRSAPPEL
ncbi:MAG TPA: ATP-binding protein [Aquabacterium sp.]|nr:ATP-binding protein [Aquabacterium sp.]